MRTLQTCANVIRMLVQTTITSITTGSVLASLVSSVDPHARVVPRNFFVLRNKKSNGSLGNFETRPPSAECVALRPINALFGGRGESDAPTKCFSICRRFVKAGGSENRRRFDATGGSETES
jgi:hypothetical protein